MSSFDEKLVSGVSHHWPPNPWGRWNFDVGVLGIVLCTLSLFCFSFGIITKEKIVSPMLPWTNIANGETSKIFSIPEDNTVATINLKQYFKRGGQESFVVLEWLPQDGSPPFSVGKELWFATGVDREGYRWKEERSWMKARFLVEKAGNYQIRLTVEGDKLPTKIRVYSRDIRSDVYESWGWWILFFGAVITVLTPSVRWPAFGLHETKVDDDQEESD